MSRIAFGSMGTRGDVYPALAIARALVRRGHQVVFATFESNRQLVEQAGLIFHILRPYTEITTETAEAFGVDPKSLGSEFVLRRIVFPGSEQTYRDLLSAGQGCDLMVLPMFLVPGQMAAERLGIPWVVTHAAPASFNSAYDPTRIPHVPWLHPLQRLTPIVPRLFKPLASRAIRSWWEPLQQLRKQEGFPALDRCPLLDGLESPFLTLALFSPLLASAQKDWPQPTEIVGFPRYEESLAPSATEAEAFVLAGSPPLIASLGSAVSIHRLRFLEATIEAARRLGQRLLLLAGPEASDLRTRLAAQLGPNLHIVSYAPYAAVFPHALALIIAGSIGPIGQAMHAGKPVLIASERAGGDQEDNATRVMRLGIGRWLPTHRYTAQRAERELRTLLANPHYAAKAAAVGDQVRREDAVTHACEALERTLARDRTAAPRLHGLMK